MDSSVGQSLYPLHRCKTIHLVRHAQGIHNVEGEKDHKAYLSEEFFDAPITPLGWNQVANLKKHVDACGLSKKIELVIASPLLRTMQTAAVVFGGEGYMDGIDAPPLMVANAGKSIHPAISSLNCPPFIAVELCRERMGVHPCDRRRGISEYKPIFPAIDFFMIESDADILWKPDTREKDEELATRGMKFLNWLWTRPEKEIAVVTHKAFLVETLRAFGNDCHPSIKSEICNPFNNCELRSFVIVDRSMMGSDSSTTNYPGKIPSESGLPSDVAKEKHPASGMPTKSTDSKTIKKATIMRKLHNCFLEKQILTITHGEPDRAGQQYCRTMQTAAVVFGGEGYMDGIDAPPLMVANAGKSSHPAISSLNCPPFIAVELCQEHLGVHPCDRRRSISEYKHIFPAIDFSMIESDADILWKPDTREKDEELATRGMKFLNCFNNCELRSLVIVDKGMLGSDSSTTKYPGKIPSGADLPSDVAKEKHPASGVPT